MLKLFSKRFGLIIFHSITLAKEATTTTAVATGAVASTATTIKLIFANMCIYLLNLLSLNINLNSINFHTISFPKKFAYFIR